MSEDIRFGDESTFDLRNEVRADEKVRRTALVDSRMGLKRRHRHSRTQTVRDCGAGVSLAP